MSELLRMEHISKRFGDFYANKDISLTVNRGEVLTLLGENGAGKSTLMNILIGLYQPTEGKIFLNGKEVRIESPSQAVKLGIGMVHQHFMLVEAMTVFENIILGDKHAKGLFIDRAARRKEIEELSAKYGLDVQLDKLITEISVGEQQRTEILKALYHGAELLILDEPTAGLDPSERINIRNYIAAVSQKMIVLFATHVVSDIECIAKDVILIRDGKICRKGTPVELIESIQGKVGELPCDLESLEKLQEQYCTGNVYQRREGLRVRIVGDPLPEGCLPVRDSIDLEDVYMYYINSL